ncbi:MAG: carboxypeptidase M32 [Candidatus Bathyarchaeia archaeon]
MKPLEEDTGLSMDSLKVAYEGLMERARELIILDSAMAVIHWDMETMMPPAAVSLRSQQLSLIERIMHKMLTDPRVGSLLKEISSHPLIESLDDVQRRNVHLIGKAYEEAVRLPEELVAETARQRAITIDIWKKAKASKDYKPFSPHLERLFELRRRAAELLMEVKGVKTPYDALIDIYEPGMASDTIAEIFSELRPRLIRIMDRCISSGQPDTSFLRRRVPVEIQRRISEALASFIGYDINSKEAWGRIDETEHPFTTGYYDDVRITTHYYEDQFTSSIFSVLHEGGHAIYERGLPREWMYQPVGSSCSYGIHESQSRFVENIVGRSREFWSYFLPKLKGLTGSTLEDVSLESFVRAVNRVEPSKIRIRADEVTYGLHIIIRFELERSLFNDEVGVSELPSAWNERYEKYLGVEVEDDSEGVMQDTHWAGGSFGYFPSYTLGNIYSGQILKAMERDLPDWRSLISSGSFKEVRSWLTTHVHRYGRLYDPADLIKLVSGSELTIDPFIRYLEEKYSTLYGFKA